MQEKNGDKKTDNTSENTSQENKEVKIEEERQALLEIKTNELKLKLQENYEYLDSLEKDGKTLYDEEYIEQSNEQEDISNKSQLSNEDKENIKEEIQNFNTILIYTFGFICFLFYLVGIFQLIDLFDATKKEMTLAFKSLFYNQTMEDQENFNEVFVNSCFRNIPEFDFAFMSSIIGSFPLKYLGFFLSSLILTIGNIILIFTFGKFNFGKINDFSDSLYLVIYLIGYYIMFGAVSLFSHEVIFEGLSDYDKIKKNTYIVKKENIHRERKKKAQKRQKENTNSEGQNSTERKTKFINYVVPEITNKEGNNHLEEQNDNIKETEIKKTENEEEESNQKYFKILCFGIMLAYFINKGINIILYHYFLDKYFGNLIRFCIIIYGLSYCLSLIFYLLFYYQLVKIKYLDNQLEKQKKRNNHPKIYRICGYLLYYDKRKINDDENDTNIKAIKNINRVCKFENNKNNTNTNNNTK